MAKGKGTATAERPDAIDGEGHPIEEAKARYGRCSDCDKPVDVVVDIYQLTDPCKWICPECRAERIREKAKNEAATIIRKGEKAAEDLLDNAQETREALVQGNLYDDQEADGE